MTSEDTSESTTPAANLDATIWPEVDRALSGITATAERGVLDVIVHVPPAEIVRALTVLKSDATLHFDYLRCSGDAASALAGFDWWQLLLEGTADA